MVFTSTSVECHVLGRHWSSSCLQHGYQSHLIFQPSMQQCNIATMKKELTHRIYDYSHDNDYVFTICLQELKFPTVYFIYHQYADSL